MQYTNGIKMCGDDKVARFVLRNDGIKPLVVIGLNPSTANEQKLDATMRRVMGFAEVNGFDSFIMLNLYPQRTPHPTELHLKRDEALHRRNLDKIKSALNGLHSPSVLLSYGDNIGCRSYLRDCLKDIIRDLLPLNPHWLHVGTLTKNGNPHHLLSRNLPYSLFEEIKIEDIIKQ